MKQTLVSLVLCLLGGTAAFVTQSNDAHASTCTGECAVWKQRAYDMKAKLGVCEGDLANTQALLQSSKQDVLMCQNIYGQCMEAVEILDAELQQCCDAGMTEEALITVSCPEGGTPRALFYIPSSFSGDGPIEFEAAEGESLFITKEQMCDAFVPGFLVAPNFTCVIPGTVPDVQVAGDDGTATFVSPATNTLVYMSPEWQASICEE